MTGTLKAVETTIAKDDPDGELGKGGKGGNGGGNKPGPGTSPVKKDKDGQEGTFAKKAKVKYNMLAKVVDGKAIHNMYIQSIGGNVEKAELSIKVVGDKNNMSVDINNVVCDQKNVTWEGNMIKGLSLNQGKPEKLAIQFEDNIVHTLTIEVYEG